MLPTALSGPALTGESEGSFTPPPLSGFRKERQLFRKREINIIPMNGFKWLLSVITKKRRFVPFPL